MASRPVEVERAVKTHPEMSRMWFSALKCPHTDTKAIVGGTVVKGGVLGDAGIVVRDSGALVGTKTWSTDVLEAHKLESGEYAIRKMPLWTKHQRSKRGVASAIHCVCVIWERRAPLRARTLRE